MQFSRGSLMCLVRLCFFWRSESPKSSVHFFGTYVLLVCRSAWLFFINIAISGVFCTNMVCVCSCVREQDKERARQCWFHSLTLRLPFDLQSQRPAVLLLINKTQIFTLWQQFSQIRCSVTKSLWVILTHRNSFTERPFYIWELPYTYCKFPVL